MFLGKGCYDRVVKFMGENQSCIIFWLIILVVFLLIFTHETPKWVNYDPEYEAKPIDFSGIDEFLRTQKRDPDDPFGITMMLGFERFTKDNLRRVMQQNWNKTIHPLYGGNVLDPIKRIHIPEDEHLLDYDSFEYIDNPLRPYLKKLSAR